MNVKPTLLFLSLVYLSIVLVAAMLFQILSELGLSADTSHVVAVSIAAVVIIVIVGSIDLQSE